MKNKMLFPMLALLVSLSLQSCMTLSHDVGKGSQTGVTTKKKQVYLLWGLLPLGSVDANKMAKGATDYTIESKINFVDALLSVIGAPISLRTQTVVVIK